MNKYLPPIERLVDCPVSTRGRESNLKFWLDAVDNAFVNAFGFPGACPQISAGIPFDQYADGRVEFAS